MHTALNKFSKGRSMILGDNRSMGKRRKPAPGVKDLLARMKDEEVMKFAGENGPEDKD